jgi:hypothetical protein
MINVNAVVDAKGNVVEDREIAAEIDLPTVSNTRQGDVRVRPVKDLDAATTPVGSEGVILVKGENGGNTHALFADRGNVFYDANPDAGERDLALGTLTIAEGARAFLNHPEHGSTFLAPGTYKISRQRELADEIRMVQD